MHQHGAALAAQEHSAEDADGFLLTVYPDESKEVVFLGFGQRQEAAHDCIWQKDEVPDAFVTKGGKHGGGPRRRVRGLVPTRTFDRKMCCHVTLREYSFEVMARTVGVNPSVGGWSA